MEAPDALTALDLACWTAYALARAGRTEDARARFAQVEQALADDGLERTSEVGWRLMVSRHQAGL